MEQSSPARTPRHLWIVAVLAVLWNAIGAFDFTMTQLRADWYLARFTPEQLDYFLSYPAWAVVVWGAGTLGAFAGSLALLLRSRYAVPLFGISLMGLFGTTIYTRVVSDGAAAMGEGPGFLIFSLFLWLVLIALLVYSIQRRRRGVLR